MANSPLSMQVNCKISVPMHKGLGDMAAKAKMPLGTYAALLLNAAYSARCKPSDDRDLDAAVGRVAILWGEGFDTAAIAEAVGLREPTVVRILDAWRAEIAGRAA